MMKRWLRERTNQALLALATALLLSLGALAVVASGDSSDGESAADTTTTLQTTTSTIASTTISTASPTTTSTTAAPTTTVLQTTTTSARATTTAPAAPTTTTLNQAPVIVDPGVGSFGMTVSVDPIVSDPEGDEITVVANVNGETYPMPDDGSPLRVTLDENEVGLESTASVEIVATDANGNESREDVLLTVTAARSVTLKDIVLTVRGGNCFIENDSVRIEMSLVTSGMWDLAQFRVLEAITNQEPNPISLFVSRGGQGRHPQDIEFILKLFTSEGTFTDVYTRTHSSSDQVLINLFRFNTCRVQLNYTIVVTNL